MGYCTTTDLEKLLPEAKLIRLTDDEATGAVNTDRLQEAIDSGQEEIDTYLGNRFDLPITGTVPPILGKMNVDIAIWNLYSRVTEEIPDTRQKRYDNAISFLEKVAEGKISIGLQPPPSPPDDGDYEGGSQVSARDKVMDSTTMEKW